MWYQVYSNGVDNDNINQYVNVINRQNNVDPSIKKLKGRQQENFMIINHWINKLSKVHILNLWLKMCWFNNENVIDWIHAILQIKMKPIIHNPIWPTKNDDFFFPSRNSRLEDENKKLGKMMEGHLENCAPNSPYRIHLDFYFIINHLKWKSIVKDIGFREPWCNWKQRTQRRVKCNEHNIVTNTKC